MSLNRSIAIYLPQFHPIPENDTWWGKGFTEWTNVVQAKTLFQGHYQPQLPADLGFYDLRLNEVFYQQIDLAKHAGLHGFMFYEYWFEGKRLLERPIDSYLQDEKISFPYFLCWANENWTKRWDGQDDEVLFKQSYTEGDFLNHFNTVYAKHIVSNKYIKVDGKPVIAIYKAHLIPNIEFMTQLWRKLGRDLGLPGLYLINCQVSGFDENSSKYFDASYEFQPNWAQATKYFRSAPFIDDNIFKKIKNKIQSKFFKKPDNFFINYEEYVKSQMTSSTFKTVKSYPCVMPGWDNTPRRKKGGAIVFYNSTPEYYEKWLRTVVSNFKPFSKDENFIFINAWNEWAEGAHLEPCMKWGHSNLEATKNALKLS